jgi:cation:H+ antiporter
LLLQISIFVASLTMMIIAGDFLVKGASRIAYQLHLSPLVVGLTIVAFGTSAPELFISLNSALKGSPDLALGNVIGSNICNLALVLGATALINPIKIQSNSIKIDWPVAMFSSLLLYVFISDLALTYWEGLIFLTILIIYIVFLIKNSRKNTMALRELEIEADIPAADKKHLWQNILYIMLGMAGLYFGSEWFVGSAKVLALDWGVSERAIGLSMVAFGTSVPELVTAVVASFKKETDLALGNLIGSNIFNILSILGITSLIKSIEVSQLILNVDMLWMLGVTFVILPMMISKKTMSRAEGGLLLASYIYYIIGVFI